MQLHEIRRRNQRIAEVIQGYGILMDSKNVALVDISEFTKRDDGRDSQQPT